LQTDTYSSRVTYTRNHNDGSAEKFVLVLDLENQKAGLLVDISTLAGSFLGMDNENYFVANSPTPHKFLITPVLDGR
jgi:hypothetical protein